MKPQNLVTAMLMAGLFTAPLSEAADAPHTHLEKDLQLLDSYSMNCLAPSITGQQLYRSEEEMLLLAHANAAMARWWWSDFLSGVNNNGYDNWVGNEVYGVYEAQGPILSYSIAPASSFASKAGVCFASTERLVEALNAVGLPGKEISTFSDKTYPVSIEQMQTLGFKF